LITRLEDDPLSLSGLRQAHYIARCLQDGKSEEEIISSFSGDSQLVKMWMTFLIHNQWMQSILNDETKRIWIVTDKGSKWLQTIEEKLSNRK